METGMAAISGLILGPLALRMTFGASYFASWTEEEELHELERLYRERGRGESLVLSTWRVRRIVFFLFDVVVAMWLRYYLDLYLDVQAMKIFWQHNDLWFLLSNFMGIVLGLLWTAVEFYKILREGDGDSELPGSQVLVVGLLIPLAGLHVTYLSVFSLMVGTKHRFLFISTLAESVLESAVSAFVQTYAVVFSSLSFADKADLYSSIALSFVSIGYAFSSLDKYDGGELMVKVPGLCRGVNTKWWIVFMFRIAEVTSRATSLALFQCVWRPWGIVSVMSADTLVVLVMSAIYQCARGKKYGGGGGGRLIRDNLVYALPSSICLMTPMLEKDSPMTLPPEAYYSLRILELGGMAGLAGWQLDWDLRRARNLFDDDALVVATFALSTVVMFLLCVVLRQFIAVRTLLEAPSDMWHMRPFNATQQVLRNRILSIEVVGKAKAWQAEQRRLMSRIRAAPHRASSLVRAEMGSDLPTDLTQAEWDARFLGAKVSHYLEQALSSLANSFAMHSDSKGNEIATSKRKLTRNPHPGPGESSHRHGSGNGSGQMGNPLRTGAMVHLRGANGEGLTSSEDGPVVIRWSADVADQKFVVEPANEEEGFGFGGSSALGEPILSGDPVRLRSLRDGSLLGLKELDYPDQALPDEEHGRASERWGLETKPDHRVGTIDPGTLFTFMLWREEEYRSARRFALSVKPLNKGCLEVGRFRPSSGIDENADDFVEEGWRVATINGHLATPQDVEAILAQARQEMDEDINSADTCQSPSRFSRANTTAGCQGAMARLDSTISVKSHSGARMKYRVCFEKAYGSDMAVNLGDRVVLRVASVLEVGAAAGAAVSYNSEIGHVPSGPEHVLGTRTIVAASDLEPLPLTVQPAEIGSSDDPPLYSWAADEIRRRAQASLVRASLAEKCRIAIVVGYNSRANRLRGSGVQACTRDLHLRMLRLFASLVRGYREVEVEYDNLDEVHEELRFGSGSSDNSHSLVVHAIDAEDGAAATAGVKVGDEIIETEVDRNGSRDSLQRTSKDIRRAIGTSDAAAGGVFRPSRATLAPPPAPTGRAIAVSPRDTGRSPPIALLFRSPVQSLVDSGLQKVLVAEAPLVAELLPTWDEIARPEDHGGEAPSCRAAAAARLLRHNELFRLRCSLVISLLRNGWELQYAAFLDPALMIHQHLDVLTRDALKARFPGTDDAAKQLREGLLAEQLDVLTSSWAAVPRAVKEQQPGAIRKLFRHDVELVAMHDAVDAAYKAWTDQTRANASIVEMPLALQRFVERVMPPYVLESISSTWIQRAWMGNEHQREYESVRRIVNYFTEIYEDTEQYWVHKLEGAATRMEGTQEQLERALESADMRVALIPSATSREELKRIQTLLSPDKLVLQEDLQLGKGHDVQIIPAGLKLVRRGQLFERFKSDVENPELRQRLHELATHDGSDLRLLFGGDDYNRARAQAAEAIEELGALIRVVKTAAAAFPDVAAQCQDLLDKHHKGELRSVTQENKRRIQIQEKEAEEMVRTANIRLMVAENQKKAAEEKYREAEEERVLAEVAKTDAQKRADQWWDNLQAMAQEKELLQSEKMQLETEKLEWTKVQSLMELEKGELQGDIERAKEERRKLEHAADKWHKTLQTVKAQAEEKEAHLKEIQAILQKEQAKQEASLAFASPASGTEDETSNFTVTQLLSVISKAFHAGPETTEAAAESGTHAI
eukprot:TRINITY_DN9397_c0_g2_i1.p1 TRINITY_DN9397_c0_g2~~TRINITY_DN9397_c0_g2_i1.p1  ORF type:complete len:1849 (+),score=364.06 TRINITY_DN9397_c0_g2_i1:468-5549(+)